MPATITHAYFGNDLYNNLSSDIKKRINYNKTSLMMFSQSTDSLMFYKINFPLIGKKYRKMHYTFHNSNTNKFFSTLITYMKKNKYYNDSDSLLFLYGFIAHFCLDSKTHPYIFYKTGKYQKKNLETYKYRGLHNYAEAYIDNYFYKARNNHARINFNNLCFNFKKFSQPLNNCINYSFAKSFNVKNMGKVYYKSLKHMKKFLILFRLDNKGIKKYLYNVIDILTLRKIFPFKTLSYNVTNFNNNDFLNNNNSTWHYPINKKITSNKSFEELYNEALIEATNIINEVNELFFNNKKININKLFKNKSHTTGINCNSNKKQVFFEF